MRVVQLIPALAPGDAVSNDTVAIHGILEGEGYETGIFADSVDPRLPAGIARPVGELPALNDDDLLIYHAATGAPLNFRLPEFGGKKVVVYHNITPPAFFHGYSEAIEQIQLNAYEGLRFLSDKVDYCIADSEYNKSDLLSLGFSCPIDVCPIIIPFDDYRREPDRELISRYSGDGLTNWLFVGRIAPNKKQEDIIRAFYCYQREINPESRLFLVGSSTGVEIYEERLRLYAQRLHIADRVIFPGHISFREILAYFSLADIFVCMSEHEGFCVPIVEAMLFGIPIAAFASSAVPDTLGQGGLLIPDKDPHLAAAAVGRILSDKTLRSFLLDKQKKQLSRFGYSEVKKQFLFCLHKAMNL